MLNLMLAEIELEHQQPWPVWPADFLNRKKLKSPKTAIRRTHQSQKTMWRVCVCVCVCRHAGWMILIKCFAFTSPHLLRSNSFNIMSCPESRALIQAEYWRWTPPYIIFTAGVRSFVLRRKHMTSCWSSAAWTCWSTPHMNLKFQKFQCFLEPGYFSVFCKSMIESFSRRSAAQLGSAASQCKLKLNTNLCEDYRLTCGPLAFQEQPDQTRWESLLTPRMFFFFV